MLPKMVVQPKSSISIGFSIINHPILGYPYFWKHPYIYSDIKRCTVLFLFFFFLEEFLKNSFGVNSFGWFIFPWDWGL